MGYIKNQKRRFEPSEMRRTVLKMAFAGSTVHIGCAFSIIEILTVLYRSFLHYPNGDPNAAGRDYFILSKGHGVMAQYACMYELGWIQDSHIEHYFKDGTDLKGLSDSRIPGLEVTSGSLGHGFSVGVGIALALHRTGASQKVYALVGDGELNEGAIWEGALIAAHHKLNNFMLIVDRNGFQAMGPTEEVVDLGDIRAKLESFGFDTAEVDGHDEAAIENEIEALWTRSSERPKALIAHTVKGKGVPFMEHDNRWHYTRLDNESFIQAVNALKSGE